MTTSEPFLCYAGFWRRFNAYGIDTTIVLLLNMAVSWLIGSGAWKETVSEMQLLYDLFMATQTQQASPELQQQVREMLDGSVMGGSFLPGGDEYVAMAISALYNILFVAGKWQATPGKRWLNLKVRMQSGEKPTLWQSAWRHAVSGISILAFGLGYITMFFSKKKLALHDHICHTCVTHELPSVIPAEAGIPLPANAGSKKDQATTKK